MKKLLLTVVAAFGFVGTAVAADLPARMPVKALPVIAPGFSWTGCYIGGYVGGAWSDREATAFDRGTYNSFTPQPWSYNTDSSVIGGGTVGCNYQPVGSPFVFGLEGEIGYLHLSGSAADPVTGIDPIASTKVGDWYGMITGRLGYSWDRALVYVKGGAAFVNVEHSIFDNVGAVTVAGTSSGTKATWTVGGGLEYALNQNWSLKAEYMFIGLDDNATTCGVIVGGGANGSRHCWDHDTGGIHTAKIGLNYRFGGAPLLARY
jgi:outer membrane immunogenic protein